MCGQSLVGIYQDLLRLLWQDEAEPPAKLRLFIHLPSPVLTPLCAFGESQGDALLLFLLPPGHPGPFRGEERPIRVRVPLRNILL